MGNRIIARTRLVHSKSMNDTYEQICRTIIEDIRRIIVARDSTRT